MRRRRLILLLLLPVYGVGIIILSWLVLVALLSDDWSDVLRDGVVEPMDDWSYWIGVTFTAVTLLGLQAVILLPVLRFRLARIEKGKSLLFSAILLAIFASAVTLGLLLGLWELGLMLVRNEVEVSNARAFGWFWWGVLTGSWLFWTAVFYLYTRRSRRPENRIGRIVGCIIGGSIVEIALIIPIDVMVRRRTDCYCATGTFFALGFSILACLWLAGPGAFIALTGKRRRAWYDEHCEVCGYERGPTPGERCPECGEVWEPAGGVAEDSRRTQVLESPDHNDA